MRMEHKILNLITVIALTVVLGCAHTQSSKMYLLYPDKSALKKVTLSANIKNKVIGINSVRLPKYLDRPLVITRKNSYELAFSDFRRWGEPLSDNFGSTISRNLTLLLKNDKIVNFEMIDSDYVDIVLDIVVVDMSGELGKQAKLVVKWNVYEKDKPSIASARTSTYSEKLKNATYDSYIIAQSKMLAQLSSDIAEAIVAISNKTEEKKK